MDMDVTSNIAGLNKVGTNEGKKQQLHGASVLFVLFFTGDHWLLVIADGTQQHVILYESMRDHGACPGYMKAIVEWLIRLENKANIESNTNYNGVARWERGRIVDWPFQANTDDCAPLVAAGMVAY